MAPHMEGQVGNRHMSRDTAPEDLRPHAPRCTPPERQREHNQLAVDLTDYLTALAPAVAAMPSCWPVPPLAPIAPMSLPLTTIGMPPSDAIGRALSGKLMKP